MADGFQVELHGVDELRRSLADAAKTIRTKAVRAALRKGAATITKEARVLAPVLAAPTKTRKPGTVRKAIVARPSKFARRAGDEGIFIGVRPLRGARQKKLGRAGAKNPNDPFYWRFLEFGTRHIRPRRFLARAADSRGAEAVNTFMQHVIPQIEKLNQKASRVR